MPQIIEFSGGNRQPSLFFGHRFGCGFRCRFFGLRWFGFQSRHGGFERWRELRYPLLVLRGRGKPAEKNVPLFRGRMYLPCPLLHKSASSFTFEKLWQMNTCQSVFVMESLNVSGIACDKCYTLNLFEPLPLHNRSETVRVTEKIHGNVGPLHVAVS